MNRDHPVRKDYETELTPSSYQNRTSFLIEDILYRQKADHDRLSVSPPKDYDVLPPDGDCPPILYKPPLPPPSAKYETTGMFQPPKRPDKPPYGYIQPGIHGVLGTGVMQAVAPADNGYIQVMGALGAYLGTPYKTISEHPYFLSQGKRNQPHVPWF